MRVMNWYNNLHPMAKGSFWEGVALGFLAGCFFGMMFGGLSGAILVMNGGPQWGGWALGWSIGILVDALFIAIFSYGMALEIDRYCKRSDDDLRRHIEWSLLSVPHTKKDRE